MSHVARDSGPAYRALLLGPFVLEREGTRLETQQWQRRVASLFKLLALAKNQRRLRDEVIEIFWPEADPASASTNLRVAAHRLRLALGDGDLVPVLSDQGWITLNPAYRWHVDVYDFEERAGEANMDVPALGEALTLWRGEPLADERYEEWAIPVRDHLQRLWRELTLRLGTRAYAQRMYGRAEECFERVLQHDPLDEEALRSLLENLYHAGKRVDALRRYHKFEEQLAEELGVPPSGETLALVQRLSTEFPPPPSSERADMRPAPLPIGRFLGALPESAIVDREEELERVLLAAERTAEGSGRLVLIAGERGVGKTRLCQEAVLRLRDRGFAVATGRCHEGQDNFPLAPFADVVARLQGHSTRDPRYSDKLQGKETPSRLATTDTVERQQVRWALANAVTALAEKRPVAVLLDDVHWADAESLDLLHHLAEQAATRRMLLVGTYRDDLVDHDHPLRRGTSSLAREGILERVSLRRLTIEDSAALVDALVGDMEASVEFSEFVYRRTRGNPFFIERMLQALGGRYSLMRQIGMGGMGRVFEAIDTTTGDLVAVKIMFARTEADPKALQRFEQEGAVLATIQHPNIVAVYETILDDFTNAIVMELLKGVPLARLMGPDPLPLARTRGLARQVTAALACAHEHGIVHRDIKPQNVMVLDNDTVKVTDFGIARLVRPKGSLTTMPSTGMTIGTPLYMAPEQIEGQRIDGRADIYSLGVVLYEAVTGQPPFTSDDPLAIAFKHVHDAPVPPSALRPDLPDDWELLILKALAKDPADRYQTVSALGQDLESLSTQPQAARAPEQVEVSRQYPSGAGRTPPPLPEVAPSPGEEAAATSQLGASQLVAEGGQPPDAKRRRAFLRWGGVTVATVVLTGAIAFVALHTSQAGPSAAAPPTAPPTRSKPSPIPTLSARGRGPGQFIHPTGVTVDAQGNVYAVDNGNARVQELSPAGRALQQFPSASSRDPAAQLNDPTNVTIGPDGKVFVTDHGNQRIAIFKLDATFVGSIFKYKKHGGTLRKFNSLAIDKVGNMYATDLDNDQVLKLSPSGAWLAQWGSPGNGQRQFSEPEGVATGPEGNVYVVDHDNSRVLEFSLAGARAKYVRTIGQGYLDHPEGVAVDHSGNVYVADTNNDRIDIFSARGHFIRAFGVHGAGRGQMLSPASVAVDGQDNIYVADWGNDRIEKFSPRGHLLWETPVRSLA